MVDVNVAASRLHEKSAIVKGFVDLLPCDTLNEKGNSAKKCSPEKIDEKNVLITFIFNLMLRLQLTIHM